MQQMFVSTYVSNGGNASKAARTAGYSEKVARITAYNLLRNPRMLAAVRLEQARVIGGKLSSLALGTLEEIMLDRKTSPAVRVDAAKTVLDRAGFVARGAPAPEG